MTPEDIAAVVEGMAPVVRDYVRAAVGAVASGLAATTVRLDAVAAAVADVGGMRERVAVLETRAPVPGPAGPAGADGVGFDDLAIEQTDDTTITILAKRGDVERVIGAVSFPVLVYAGDFESGKTYTPGNLVRAKSAIWHCRRTTTIAPDAVTHDATGKPAGPQGKDFWTLVLRDGKRGTDGKSGERGPAGAAGRDWQQVYDDTRGR